MGYCPLCIRQPGAELGWARRRASGTRVAGVGGTGARGVGLAGRWVARVRGRQARGARPGRAVGPVGYALGALSLFLARFDSVLFMSQFLDIVREPGS